MKDKKLIYGIIAVITILILTGYVKIPGFQAAYLTEKCYDITYENGEEIWIEVPCPEAEEPAIEEPAVTEPIVTEPVIEEELGIFDTLMSGKNFWIILIILVFIIYYFGFEMGPKKGFVKSKKYKKR